MMIGCPSRSFRRTSFFSGFFFVATIWYLFSLHGTLNKDETSSKSQPPSDKAVSSLKFQSLNPPPSYSRSHRHRRAAVPDGLSFVLVLGLEATGHHLVWKIVDGSPTFAKLVKLGIHPNKTEQLLRALWRGYTAPTEALWSATCQRNKRGQRFPSPNVTQLQTTVVEILQSIQQTYDRQQQVQNLRGLVVPINVLEIDGDAGQISYPNFAGPCRPLSYPNLHVWLEACTLAKVECQMVYLYRHPYSVLASTMKRHFHADWMQAIHLHTTQLQILHSQLTALPPQSILDCWGMYYEEQDGSTSPFSWRNSNMGQLLGWTNRTAFEGFVETVYHPPKSLNVPKLLKELQPYQPYLETLLHVHERVVQLCYTHIGGTL